MDILSLDVVWIIKQSSDVNTIQFVNRLGHDLLFERLFADDIQDRLEIGMARIQKSKEVVVTLGA